MGEYLLKKFQTKIQLTSTEKKKEKNKKVDKIKFAQRFAQEISIEPALQMPYGFHFDDYIVQNREEAMQKESFKFENLITLIFEKLKVRNEFELVLLYKHAFSQVDKENFKEKARKCVLMMFLKEIARFRKEDEKKFQKSAERYFEDFEANKEFYLSSLKDMGSFFSKKWL